MATFSEVVNEVTDDILRDDLTAQCSAALIMAIRHYDRKQWWFSEGSSTFTTSATQEIYTLPSNFRQMNYAEAKWPGDNFQELRARTFPEVRHANEGQTVTGYPEMYAIRDQKIHLAYTPNGEYEVKLYYLKALDDLSADGSNEWTTDCKDLIRAAAAKTVALRTLHDKELAAIMSVIEVEEAQRLNDETARRTTRSRIRPIY